MRPRWETWVAIFGLVVPACAVHQHQEVTIILPPDEPLRGYATGALSLGESPGDLTAAQINAALTGYGSWSDSVAYGRIWRPNEAIVRGTFVPYGSAGQWIATDGGWFWQSDYAWGRVPFHYGRWVLDGSLWSWVPGSQFAPAWVDWRTGGGWVGWSALAPIGARSWAPFAYCAHARLGGRGLEGRMIQGPASASLYPRTTALATEGDAPRGPALQPGPVGLASLAHAWSSSRPAAATSGRSPSLVADAVGVDSVERIPVSLIREAPPVVDPPVGGVAVVIRDRDLLGMSEGPSVRGPVGAAAVLPDLVISPRPVTVVVALPTASPRRSMAAPPPLPPPPDGVATGGFFGGYPTRAPMAFASRRGSMNSSSFGEPSMVVAPSPPPAAPPVAQPGPVGTSGTWSGSRASSPSAAPRPGAPFSTVQ